MRNRISSNRKITPFQNRPWVVHEQERQYEQWEKDVRGSVRWCNLFGTSDAPTDLITMGIMELEPGEENRLKRHRHPQPEAYYIIKGNGIIRNEDNDYPVRAGSAIYIPGDTDHEVINTGSGSDMLKILYYFPADSFDEIQYVFS